MQLIYQVFGTGKALSILQMTARAIVVFNDFNPDPYFR